MAGHPKVKHYLDKVWKIHQQKNSDYSNADHSDTPDVFSNFRECEDFGTDILTGILVRMSDKWSRVKNIHAKGGDNAVPGEGLEDGLLDLIGYAAIYLAEMNDQIEQDVRENEMEVSSSAPQYTLFQYDDEDDEEFVYE